MRSVAFLHGLLGRPSDWLPLAAQLPEFATQCVSLRPATDWQTGIKQLVQALPSRGVLIGYSLGARLALACGLAAPEKFRGLVLISGHPGLTAAERPARYEQDRKLSERLRLEPPTQFLQRWYREGVFASLSEATVQQLVREKLTLDRPRQADLLRTYSIAQQPDFWPRLPTWTRPVAVLAGERDTKYCELAKRMAAALPRGRLYVVPNAGHIVQREKPEQFLSILREFLAVTFEESDADE